MKIIAVVPAYNESSTIGFVVKGLRGRVDEIIVVDDGSKDNTYELAASVGAVALRHFLNRGQGAALKTGIDYALGLGAEIIITFDADGQHDVKDIEKLIEPITKGSADVVLGSRFKKFQSSKFKVQSYGIPFFRFLILKLALIFTRITTGLKVTDTHNGLRALSMQAAQKINIQQDGMAHASEILEEIAKYNFRYIEVPITIHYTEYSKQKGQSSWNAFKILWDLVVGKISK
ncbi:MAG: Glycosyl transferase family 2 [Parcubacteria group bacterium GW2011_GWA2_38_13]|nr:MAG: Glycosyl transferase family 2 [Parcubacteria group bacterium GW2011_GWA2_38_13]